MGRFPKEFNALAPVPHKDTVALLQSLGAHAENLTAKFKPGTVPQIRAIVPYVP